MPRISAGCRLGVVVGLVLVLFAAAVPAHAADAPGSTWPASRGLPSGSGRAGATSLTGPLVKAWSRQVGTLAQTPLIADGRVFVRSGLVQTDDQPGGQVSAYDLASGAPLWGPVELLADVTGLAYEAGRVFAVDFQGRVYALDAVTGRLLWRQDLLQTEEALTPYDVEWQYWSDPVVYGDHVYVDGIGVDAGLFAIDIATGRLLWGHRYVGGSAAPAVDADGVYGGGSCGAASAFSHDGALLWAQPRHGYCGGRESPVADDAGHVLLPDDSTGPAGVTVRRAQTGSGQVLGTYIRTADAEAQPVLTATTRFEAHTAGPLVAVELRNGRVLWSSAASGYSAPVLVGDQLVAARGPGTVDLLDARTGALRSSARYDLGTPYVPPLGSLLPRGGLAVAAGRVAIVDNDRLTVLASTGVVQPRITSGPPLQTTGTAATWTFTSAGLPTTCVLDGVARPCSSPFSAAVAPGRHLFELETSAGGSTTTTRQAFRSGPTASFDARGAVDSALPTVGGVQLIGWASQPGIPDPISVAVYVDGRGAAIAPAALRRSDLLGPFPDGATRHGYQLVVKIPDAGTHQVCVYALATGPVGNNTTLGCRSVVITHEPLGSLDAAYIYSDHLHYEGWAIDLDDQQPVDVSVTLDGQWLQTSMTEGPRPDVLKYYAPAASPEFTDVRVTLTSSLTPGQHQVCATALNRGAGSGDTSLGCRSFTV